MKTAQYVAITILASLSIFTIHSQTYAQSSIFSSTEQKQ